MTREEMQRVLGKGTNELHMDMLESLDVVEVDVIHERALLVGSVEPTADEKLKEAFYDSGTRRRFTGYQMAGHRRDVELHQHAERLYFAPTGGNTMVSLKTRGGKTFEGFARCSEKDVFDRTVGRRIAFTRALLDAFAADFPSPPESRPPKPRLGLGNSTVAEALRKFRLSPGVAEFARTLSRHSSFGSMHSVGPLNSPFLDLFGAIPDHVRLERRALRKLEEAAGLDVEADEAEGKKERKRLREQARVLREQALADAGVAAQIKPDPEPTPTAPTIRNEA